MDDVPHEHAESLSQLLHLSEALAHGRLLVCRQGLEHRLLETDKLNLEHPINALEGLHNTLD